MAPLKESEMRKILGPNYIANNAGDEPSRRRRNLTGEIESLNGMKSMGVYGALIGVALILAAWYSVTGRTLMIQEGVGGGVVLLGLIIWLIARGACNRKKSMLDAI